MPLNKDKALDLLESGFWMELLAEAEARAFKDWKDNVKTSGSYSEIQARISFDGYIERALRKAASKQDMGE